MPKLINFKYLLILVSLTLFSCSDHQLPKLEHNSQILAFGDSLTLGVGAKSEHSYPAQLSSLTNLKVINAGVSGEKTAQGIVRFNQLLDESHPDLIILLEGGNDILQNVSESEIKKNLALMIERAKQENIPILMIGVPKKSLFSSSASFYRELSEDYELLLDDEIISKLIKSPSMKSDSVHFNQKGYLKLAEKIHSLLISHGALN